MRSISSQSVLGKESGQQLLVFSVFTGLWSKFGLLSRLYDLSFCWAISFRLKFTFLQAGDAYELTILSCRIGVTVTSEFCWCCLKSPSASFMCSLRIVEIAIRGTKLALFSAIRRLKDDFLFSPFFPLSNSLGLSRGWISKESVAIELTSLGTGGEEIVWEW